MTNPINVFILGSIALKIEIIVEVIRKRKKKEKQERIEKEEKGSKGKLNNKELPSTKKILK